MNSKLLTLILFVSTFCLAHAAEQTDKHATTSEMYIKGFKENFASLPVSQQDIMAKGITDLGQKFELVVDSSGYYIEQRNKRVASLRNKAMRNDAERYDLNRSLIDEYIHFSFDSAFSVGERNLSLAQKMNDADKMAESKIDLANVFIQGGYFREASQYLDEIDLEAVSDTIKTKALISRFNMEFENGFFFAWNLQEHDVSEERMRGLYDQIINRLPDDAYEIYQLRTKKSFYKHDYKSATSYCDILLLKCNDQDCWDYIKALGDMGYNKMGTHEYVDAMEYMVKSASLAIRKGALNNPALRKIAELLFVVGDNDLASKLINKSMDNAMEFNSKYRIIESAKGYPMINRQLNEQIERNHRTLKVILAAMAILVIVLAVSLWYSRSQHKKVRQQALVISKYNEELKERNKEIESSNARLTEIHGVTAILMSKVMKGASIRREMVDKMYKDVSMKVKVKQYNDIPEILGIFVKELKTHRVDVDEILLAFFPNFVEQFNRLLKEDSRFSSEKGTLPTEVRIFALWRIGVKKNEEIARCMDYSLNTIKSYKTRVINSSLYEKEEFYDRLMQIKVNVTV